MSSRALMFVLPAALLASACDKGADAPVQANAEGAAANAVAADEVSPDEARAAPPPAASKAGFDRSRKGSPLPDAALTGLDGKSAPLKADGRPMLVNVWATWCAPCVKELPTLDRLAAGGVRVVAVSQDAAVQGDAGAKVRPFLMQRGLKHLDVRLDPELALGTAYAANLPVTILYDGKGREVWRRAGDFDWTSAEAAKAVAEAG